MANGEKAPLTLGGIKAWLPLIAIIISLVISFTVLQQQVAQVRAEQCSMEARLQKEDTRLSTESAAATKLLVDIQVRLAEIQRDIVYIRQQLDARE